MVAGLILATFSNINERINPMGADLYINKLHNKCLAENEPQFNEAVKKRNAAKNKADEARYQAEVSKYYDLMHGEGYFRDSYNGTSLGTAMDFSWWRDVIPMLDSDGNLDGENLKAFLARIESGTVKTLTKAEMIANGIGVKSAKDVQEWNDYFVNKRIRLIGFLKQAIDLGEPIYCSL